MAAPTKEDALPASFFCPLTHEVMRDPVVDPEGNTYERSAIEQWLKKDATSPITRTPLQASSLIPNRALRDAIEGRFKELGKELPAPNPNVEIHAPKPMLVKEEEVGPETVQLKVVAARADGEEHDVLVSIQPPAGSARTPVDICCVVDISGSMGTEATIKDAGGNKESHGLSLLDIVKHAVKTIAHTLTPIDRLAIVTYSTNIKTELNLTFMDAVAKATVEKKLDALQPDDSTNIWGGLETGLEVLRNGAKPGRQPSLLLLTDGWPNICPPRGEVQMFKRYKDTKQLPCTVSTFGFGYSLNSELLATIATEGEGMFSFIPDSSFVGTAFVNATSNLLVSLGTKLSIALEPQNGASIVSIAGGYKTAANSWGTLVNLPSLQYGQNLGVVVRMKIPDSIPKGQEYLTATLKYDHWNFTQQQVVTASGVSRDGSVDLNVQKRRSKLVDGLKNIMMLKKIKDAAGVQQVIKDLVSDFKNGTDPREIGLLEDVTGQIAEATSKDEFFDRWGQHYLPSLCRSHQLQQSNNFKDPGIQFYGGDLFQKLRDDIDDIYNKLPPPKPTRPKPAPTPSYSYGGGGHRPAPAAYASNFSMSTYNSRAAGCFAGSSTALMEDGNLKRVDQIRKGDVIRSVNNTTSTVQCVLKTVMRDGKADLVELDDGLLVTPYHPIRVNGVWTFPKDVKESSLRECDAVYTFVVDKQHVMIINNVECITLGHGFTDNEVVAHPYFGSGKILEDLAKLDGWADGLVSILSGSFVRDPVTDMICGISKQEIVSRAP